RRGDRGVRRGGAAGRRGGRGGAGRRPRREPPHQHVRGHGGPAPQAGRPRRRAVREGLAGHAHGARRGRPRRPAGRGGWLMLYELLVPLVKYWSAFNVFRYITFRTAMATITAIVISFALGPWMIRRLRRLQHGEETIREDTPERHRSKAGTPTMGGLVILAAILASTLLWTNLYNHYVWVLIFATTGLGVIGFLDDRKKLRTRRGISARQKFGSQILLIGALMAWLYLSPPDGFTTGLAIPFLKGWLVNLGRLWIPFAIVV